MDHVREGERYGSSDTYVDAGTLNEKRGQGYTLDRLNNGGLERTSMLEHVIIFPTPSLLIKIAISIQLAFKRRNHGY